MTAPWDSFPWRTSVSAAPLPRAELERRPFWGGGRGSLNPIPLLISPVFGDSPFPRCHCGWGRSSQAAPGPPISPPSTPRYPPFLFPPLSDLPLFPQPHVRGYLFTESLSVRLFFFGPPFCFFEPKINVLMYQPGIFSNFGAWRGGGGSGGLVRQTPFPGEGGACGFPAGGRVLAFFKLFLG